MKCVLVVFIALIALVAGDEEWTPVRTDEEMQVLHDDCVKGIALTKKQLEMIDNIKYPNEKEVRDYVLCLVKRMNLFTEQGGFDSNRLMGQIDALGHGRDLLPTSAREKIEKCPNSTVDYSDAAERAYGDLKCIFDIIDEEKKKRRESANNQKE